MRGGFINGRGVLILAWISFAFAVAGGAALAGTFVGGIVSGVVRFFPGWVSVVAFGLGVVGLVIDLANDGIPNRLAIWMGILLPSFARAVPGKLSGVVTQFSHQLLGYINQSMGEWVGTTSTIGVAVAAVGISLLVARRVVNKGAR